ncbi:GntR family transcriptional regulator [Rhizorhapis sp. SPR117]|uniref:GntR family transcriptional regulator n=1 Tax=Rhizorhapis sp. SPR117 TaxID=2912611 RepID=UPI001F024BC1|nr:GntR family transcriptional regulator [Rhizorhapis sp. SPR117]
MSEGKPVYLRLREIITASILDGEYQDGDMLPSVRAFAAQQGANPLTVAKAYQSFQDDGLVVVRRGIGMFVADGATRRLHNMERTRFLQQTWPAIAEHMRRIGITIQDLPTDQSG